MLRSTILQTSSRKRLAGATRRTCLLARARQATRSGANSAVSASARASTMLPAVSKERGSELALRKAFSNT